jgi:hypothetical protein
MKEIDKMREKNKKDIEEYSDEWCEQALIEYGRLEEERELKRKGKSRKRINIQGLQ